MHWLLRAAAAVVVGCVAGSLWFHGTFNVFGPTTALQDFVYEAGRRIAVVAGEPIAFSVVWLLPPIVPSLIVYGLLTRRYYRSRIQVGEPRCRQCGYILRGIAEPRCPECGEAI